MVEIAAARWSMVNESFDGSASRSRRLEMLREQLLRENRRSAGPFSHPLVSRGSLWDLREQIRDMSRIADAVATSADLATDTRLDQLCSDLRRLLETQRRWTERLENQIWRLESQGKLMRRLQQLLLHGSPGTDQIWEICELIARETQAVPEGLLLLPEPGHRISLSSEGVNFQAARAIEKARLSVFAAASMLPRVRGADLVAGSFHASAGEMMRAIEQNPLDETVIQTRPFAQQLKSLTPQVPLAAESLRLLKLMEGFALQVEGLSTAPAERAVPPDMKEFYRVLANRWPDSHLDEEIDQEMARNICAAFGLLPHDSELKTSPLRSEDDSIVLTHKLRWHDAESPTAVASENPAPTSSGKRMRRPNFLRATADGPTFSVFAE